jgi:hypothetical protein
MHSILTVFSKIRARAHVTTVYTVFKNENCRKKCECERIWRVFGGVTLVTNLTNAGTT